MGLNNPEASGTTLTSHQLAKIAALPVPDQYDDGRPLTARTVVGITSDVKLAVNVDSGATVDVSANAHALTLAGDAAISTTQKWAGDSSIYFPGEDGDQVTTPYHADFDIQTSDFDIRFAGWHQGGAGSPWNAGSGDGVGIWTSAEKAFHLSLRSSGGSNPTLHFSYSTVGSDDDGRAVAIGDYANINEWNHFRACRFGDLFMMFVNERLVYTEDFTGVDIHTPTLSPVLAIGDFGAAGADPWEGYIDGIFMQVGGTVVSGEYLVDRQLFSASDQVIYRPETGNTVLDPHLIDTDRELSPIDGEHFYRFTGAHTATLKAMSTWGGWRPHFLNNSGSNGTVSLNAADTVDGSGSDIVIPTTFQCKIHKETSTTGRTEGNFYRV